MASVVPVSAPAPSVPSLPPMPSSVRVGAVPAWDLNRLTHRACPACGTDDAQPVTVRPDRLTVHRCQSCDHLHLADIPTADQVLRFYQDYSQFKGFVPKRAGLVARQWRRWTDPYIGILETSGGIAGRAVADVGCAFGNFLQVIRAAGGRPYGVELDEEPLRFLASIGIPAAPDFDRHETEFDVVTAFHLFEHLADPGALLRQIARRMKPDGRLLLAMPNGDDAAHVGPGWVGYRVDLEHFNYFSLTSLSHLLSRHGFWVEQHWENCQPMVSRQGAASGNRLLRVGRRAAQKLLAGVVPESRLAETGQYCLSVLARYCPSPTPALRITG